MDFILIIGIFEALTLAFLVFFKRNRNVSDSILASFFLLFAINITLIIIETYNRNNSYPFPAFINTTAPFILLHGPVLWFYIYSQTKQNFKIKPVYFIHLLPFVAMIIDHAVQFYFLPVEEKIYIATTEIFKEYFTYPLWVFMITLSPLIYFSWGIRMLNQYNKRIKYFLSQTEHFDFKWLKQLLYIITIIYCLVNLSFIIDVIFPLASFNVLQYSAFILASLFILFMGIYGRRQSNLFKSKVIKVNLSEVSVNGEKGILEKEDKDFIIKLQNYMNTEKPYLNPDITLANLSEQLKVSAEYLSEILNKKLNKKFFDFINYYRIEEFKNQLQLEKNKKLTLTGIAMNSGFNSKATFNRVFKTHTHITPSQYKLSVSEK